MSKVRLLLKEDRVITVEKGTVLYDIVKENNLLTDIPVVLCNLNGKLHELRDTIEEEGTFSTVDIRSKIGHMTYVRTLQFILIKAVIDIFPSAQITIEHSINKGLFGEIHKEDGEVSIEDIKIIKARMKEIIDSDLKIEKVQVSKKEAIEIFKEYNMNDKLRLLNSIPFENVKLYKLGDRYDYFYGPMTYSTGSIKIFDLVYYKPGFILRYPTQNDPFKILVGDDQKKLAKIFYETEQWGHILNVPDVGSLNEIVLNGNIIDMIRVTEALHEKKIAYISDMISEKKSIKIVLIAGPSSSGKTTFGRRLGIQLMVNGITPVPISLDDYFVDRELTPKDENGEYDFESIYALDLKLFNENLEALLNGKEVELPQFNFKTGKREYNGKKITLPQNGILVIEGIHGLNEKLTEAIPKENKFKIYISALTQLNLDNHNRISTTDVRMIRRIVRDSLSRGYGAEDTLKMWASIKRGEQKNIFVFQEEADVMFNSTLVYELCVLKKYALEELSKIDSTSPVYYEAWRLRSFLNFFKDVDKDYVPDNSILREFIGGSCFYKY